MMPQTAHWHPDADFSKTPFFIRRMDTSGYIRPSEAPAAQLPLIGFLYVASGEVLIDIVRIQRAKRMLSSTPLPIIDIAAAVGVEDQSYFSRLFKKETGMTPTAFREKNWGNPLFSHFFKYRLRYKNIVVYLHRERHNKQLKL